MFSLIDTKTSLSKQEERILDFWDKEGILQKTIEEGKKRPVFSFYDGPPFATGLPHYGHLLVGTIKDCVLRYKYMKGFAVSRRFGWDCHGLPVENEIEKVKNLSGVSSIESFGIDKFNEECRNIVLRYTNEWKFTVNRFGRWVDFSDVYRTMDPSFMESVWWVFAELWRKGLIYEGFKVMPYSAKLGTPLSNFEASENYKEVDDPSIVVALTLEEDPKLHLLVWTTTPWTLPSNLAIVVHPDIMYVVIEEKTTKNRYILAEDRLGAVMKDAEGYERVGTMQGRELVGKRYHPLFPYFVSCREKGAFQVLGDTFVSVEDGTGLVHAAPGFGEVDFYACQKANIPVVCPVDQNGRFTEEVEPYKGRNVKECDKDIIKELKAQKRVLVHEVIRHRYPFCWRSDTPLIYKAVSTWFVHVEKIKENLLASNEQINWVPDHIKHGRFGKWLENARDWAISRNRYWGTPIPIWRADDGEIIVVESKKMLEDLTGTKIEDLHRHFLDHLTIVKNGKVYRRISEVFDCWFESGSMPYAQQHYPFENQDLFGKLFPADFIAEALDQTRGWFYTLNVLSTALFQKPAFKNVVVNGIVLAEDGNKMSKRLKNYPDPLDVLAKYGADAIRLYMLASPAVHGDDMCFSESGVELVLRGTLLPLVNSVSFFTTYAQIYSFQPKEGDFHPKDELDRWILSVTEKLIEAVSEKLDAYDLSGAAQCIQPFIDYVTNWYIRRSRRRFWSSENTQDRQDAFETLYRVLKTLTKVIAPFAPFTSENIWQVLKQDNDPISVHLVSFPEKVFSRDQSLEEAHALAMKVTQMAHALRKNIKIKVRQVLSRATIVCSQKAQKEALEKVLHIIADEINVKEIAFHDDDSSFVTMQAKPNFKQLGKRVGKRLPIIQKALLGIDYKTLSQFLKTNTLALLVEGEKEMLSGDEVEVIRNVKEGVVAMHEDGITIALDTALNEELLVEGLSREIVNKLNTARREKGFSVTDRINIFINGSQRLQDCVTRYKEYIEEEALIKKLSFETHEGEALDVNGESVTLFIEKV